MEKKKKFLKIYMLSSVGNSFTNWLRILAANKFKVGFKYIPRAIIVTFITIILSPFVFLEKLIYNKKIKKAKVISPVFIIGHMRSGTTFLHYLMSKDERFAYPTTTEAIFPWVFLTLNKILRAFMSLVLPQKRPMDNMKINENLPQEEELAIANLCPYSPNNGAYFPKNLEEFYHKYSLFENVSEKVIKEWKKTYLYFLKKISYKSEGKQILSKSLVNAGRINLLLQMFPDAKFIFIYRNPYKVFLSTKKLYKKFIFEHMAFHDISDNELENIMLRLAKIGYIKYFKDRELIKNGNLIEVKFEEFVKNPIKNLEKIYNTLNIDDFEKAKPGFISLANDYENYKPDKYEIKDSLREKIYKELKIIFDKYGYSKTKLD